MLEDLNELMDRYVTKQKVGKKNIGKCYTIVEKNMDLQFKTV